MGYAAKPPSGKSGWDRALPVVAVLVGLAVGVLVGYVAFGSDDGGSGSGSGGSASGSSASFATGSEPVELPESLGAFRDTIVVSKEKAGGSNPPAVAEREKNAEEVARRTVEAYKEAYGGAGVGVRAYSDESLERQATVIAVRARVPGLTIGPVLDPKYLRLAKAQNEIVKFGETECQVFNGVVPEGREPDPEMQTATICQRPGDKITVFVFGGFNGADGPTTMAKLADDAYAAVAGG
jgi:hypothetical protein